MILKWRKDGRKARVAPSAGMVFEIAPSQRKSILKALSAAPWRRDRRSTDWAGFAILDALGLERENIEDGIKARNLIRGWLSDGTLEEFFGPSASRQIKPFLRVAAAARSDLFS
jgi:hypothetical protein